MIESQSDESGVLYEEVLKSSGVTWEMAAVSSRVGAARAGRAAEGRGATAAEKCRAHKSHYRSNPLGMGYSFVLKHIFIKIIHVSYNTGVRLGRQC